MTVEGRGGDRGGPLRTPPALGAALEGKLRVERSLLHSLLRFEKQSLCILKKKFIYMYIFIVNFKRL